MKTITHLMSGLAVASCFPVAVTEAAAGNPLYILLGGGAAVLPTLIDNGLIHHFTPFDAELIPDPLDPDPQLIAQAVADSIDTAQRPFQMRIHRIRLDRNRWQSFKIHLDPSTQAITVTLTQIVNQADQLLRPENESDRPISATATFESPLRLECAAAIEVGARQEAHLKLSPAADRNSVTVELAPWKRKASHSIAMAMVFAVAVGTLWNPLAGLILFSGYSVHLLLDHLGFMGAALLWPFRRQRIGGLKHLQAAHTWPNVILIWLSTLVVYINLAINTTPPLSPPVNPLRLLVLGGLLPLGLIRFAQRHMRKRDD